MSTISIHATPAFTRPAPQLRLTRRGRLVVFVAAMLAVLAIAIAFGASSMATNEAGVPQETEMIMVGQGETLWDISSDLATDGDVRAMMHTIEELNALDSSMLLVGQELYVPAID
ncbi:MAG: LysM peptidoglycan-binding domain-containing protein [Nocardioides sp.]|nr:LysM peptidoglycan-binding domain-containing protein [Nocardioides sp.]